MVIKKAGIRIKSVSCYQHDYFKFNQDNFLSDFNNIIFSHLNENNLNVNDKFDRFFANLNDLVRKYAPLKKLTKNDIKLRNKPWINSRIQKMVHQRDKLLKKLRRKSDVATKNLYKKFRNCVVIELNRSKANYFNTFFHAINNNVKLLWSGIKKLSATGTQL